MNKKSHHLLVRLRCK